MSEYVDFNTMISEKVQEADDREAKMLFEYMSDSGSELYQLQGITGTNTAVIKYIGNSDKRPTILLHKFKFDGYLCTINSLVYDNSDIEEINETCCLKMMTMTLNKKNSIRAVVTIEFHTFDHVKAKKHISEYISRNDDIPLSGFYCVYLKRYINGEIKKIKLDMLQQSIERNNIVYMLPKYLSHEELAFLFKS